MPAEPTTPTPGRPPPATLPEALDTLAAQLGTAASTLRDLLARASLFDNAAQVRWQLLTVLKTLGVHQGTVRELRRLVDPRPPPSR